jgi:hypothetical protein
LHNVNISSTKHPKIASIGDYWDEHTMTKIQALLREYDVGMFYRQRMLVIDGKYNKDDGLSIGRM